jgi:methionyl-tRNA synthetase
MKNNYYITTTLPYVNADPHIGFALEIVQADVLARWRTQRGDNVLFNTGTDEHGQKIYQAALDSGQTTQEYCDYYANKFNALKELLNLSFNKFIRTTDEYHVNAAQEFWNRCKNNIGPEGPDIYKKQYKTKYCVGCELEKTDSELVNGKCPIHPNKEIELREEDNYFFRFTRYESSLKKFYDEHSDFVVPDSRLKEIKSFAANGLQDFSISRLKAKMPWGVPVPGDKEQVMYVWFDALVNYVSTLGWPAIAKTSATPAPADSIAENSEPTLFDQYWPGVQVAGKDNLRQQAAMWQAMLMSAGLAPSKQIFIHGFMTHDGQKMSKSLGNVVNPLTLVEKYGTDAVRYYLLKAVHPFEDSDFSITNFETLYNSDLANGLGNLVSRVANLIEKNFPEMKITDEMIEKFNLSAELEKIDCELKDYRFDRSMEIINSHVKLGNRRIEDDKLWELVKTDQKSAEIVLELLATRIHVLGIILKAFLPATAEKLLKIFSVGEKITKPEPLFKRI